MIVTRDRRITSWVGLTLVCALCCSCSLLINTDQKQCTTDADCLARGFAGKVCVAELCQSITPVGGSGNLSVMTEPSAGAAGDSSLDGASGDSAGSSAAANGGTGAIGGRGGSAGRSGAGAPRAGAGGIGVTTGADTSTAGMGAAGMSTTAGAGGAGACQGASCPECSNNADCEKKGIASGLCVDSMCWAPEPQCDSDDDCTKLGPEYEGGRCVSTQCKPNPRWRCEVPPPPPPTGMKDLKVLIRDSLSLAAVSGVHVVACQKLDLTCTSPIAEATTGKDGYLAITLPANFAGYLQQTEATAYTPAMYFLPTSLPEDGMLQPFPLLGSGALLDALAAALGGTIDPKRGNMMLIAEDCFGMALAGVAFSSPQKDKTTVQFYVRDLLPSPDATETAEVGNGGFLNFPAGTGIIEVKQVKTMLSLATVSVVVRAGFISVAYIRPQPR